MLGESGAHAQTIADMGVTRPLLLLDVDGVILPVRRANRPRPAFAGPVRDVVVSHMPGEIAECLIDAAPALWRLFEIRWATSWEEMANEDLAGLLGWPRLPCLSIIDAYRRGDSRLSVIQAAAGDRPLAWCEDEGITPSAHAWGRARSARGIATCLVRPDSEIGLTPRRLARIIRFGEQLAGAHSEG